VLGEEKKKENAETLRAQRIRREEKKLTQRTQSEERRGHREDAGGDGVSDAGGVGEA
jgi:hypothetical protein